MIRSLVWRTVRARWGEGRWERQSEGQRGLQKPREPTSGPKEDPERTLALSRKGGELKGASGGVCSCDIRYIAYLLVNPRRQTNEFTQRFYFTIQYSVYVYVIWDTMIRRPSWPHPSGLRSSDPVARGDHCGASRRDRPTMPRLFV